jgi:hypothetical protein
MVLAMSAGISVFNDFIQNPVTGDREGAKASHPKASRR